MLDAVPSFKRCKIEVDFIHGKMHLNGYYCLVNNMT